MDKIQSLSEVLSMLRRRFFLWTGVIAIGLLVSLAYALSLPREYQTSATIQIEQPSIRTGEQTASALNAAMLQKLQIVEQRVMARDNLLAIIDKFELYSDGGLSGIEKVALLRRSATVSHVINPDLRWRQDISPSALLVTVRMSDPVLAADVANELVTNVLEQEQRRRTERVRETLAFFESEEARIGAAITDLEAEIAAFKEENAALLPGGVEILRNRQAELQQTELEVEREIIQLQNGSSGSNTSVRAQRVRRLQEERELYRIEIAEIEAAIASAPRVDQQFNRLERKLRNLEEQYAAITVGKAQAEMDQMLEANRQADSFAVLEEAVTPEWPIAPSRKKILGMGGMLSAVVALILVFLFELRSPFIWTRSQFERQLRMRAVAVIPAVEQTRQRRHRLVKFGLRVFAGFAAFIAFAGIILKFSR